MSCRFIGVSLAAFTLFLCGNLNAQEGSEDPFGEVIEQKKESAKAQKSEAQESDKTTANSTLSPTKGSQTHAKPASSVEPGKTQTSLTQGSKTDRDQGTDDENPFQKVDTAEGNHNQTASAENRATAQPRPFEEKFWEYLKSNAYENWSPIPGESGDFGEGKGPHGAYFKMYLNRTAAGATEKLPYGSIIVKENYNADRKTLDAITVMYRSRGYNPTEGDWYWVKFNPDGSVARNASSSPPNKIMGRARSCIECHSSAKGNDSIFFNDK